MSQTIEQEACQVCQMDEGRFFGGLMRSELPMFLGEFGRFGWVCRVKAIKIGEEDFPMLWEGKYTVF